MKPVGGLKRQSVGQGSWGKLLGIGLGLWLIGVVWSGLAYAAQPGIFVIEAEDFNYGGGKSKPEASQMPYLGGAYQGLSAVHNIDYHRNDSQTVADSYRIGEQPNVPMLANPDYDREAWKVRVNYRLGWITPGTWFNYTRTFPEGYYRVYAALSHGSTGDHLLQGAMYRVVSGADSTVQQLELLGKFDGPGTGQWGQNALVPMQDDQGRPVIVHLQGTVTLRFQADSGDVDYYKFVPLLPPQITQQPEDATVEENQSVEFRVEVQDPAGAFFQWQSNRVEIPGATSAVYRIDFVPLKANGARYRCVISNAVGVVSSREAVLHVTPDHTPPQIVKWVPHGVKELELVFSEPIDPVTGLNPQNYHLSGGGRVTAVRFGEDARTLLLSMESLQSAQKYTLTITGILDTAETPNPILPGTQIEFIAVDYTPVDIGPVGKKGSSHFIEDGFDETGSGIGIGTRADSFHFNYRQLTGDFDIKVRLKGMDLTNPYAQAGLMARKSLRIDSAFVGVIASPGPIGVQFLSRSVDRQNTSYGNRVPAAFPNTWLRLRRVGNQFTGYVSYDSRYWFRLGTVTVAMPATIYVGHMVSSCDNTIQVTASFREIGEPQNPIEMDHLPQNREPLAPSSRMTRVVISEIMYHPPDRSDGRDLEFIELANPDSIFEEIGGWELTGDIHYVFPEGTVLPAGGFLVVAKSPEDIKAVYGITNVVGPYEGRLNNNGGVVRLRNRFGAIFLEVPFQDRDPWPAAADGAGHSLILARPSYGEADPKAWAPSARIGGSPGAADPYWVNPWDGVVINEFLAHTDDPQVDFIELFNRGKREIDLSGCILTDDPSTNRFVIPEGTKIPPGGFLVFDQNELGFALSSMGEAIFLIAADHSRVLDAYQFEAQANGRSFGRWPDGQDEWQPLDHPTPGASNARPWEPPVVINEIMYDPISADSNDEYVELYNRTQDPIDVSGWRFIDGIDFTIPEGTIIPAKGFLVVAKNAERLRANYPQLNETNTVGNYQGVLSDKGERIALAQPDTVVVTNREGIVRTNTIYVLVDEVTYRSGGRWGQWSAGLGSSLELVDPYSDNRRASNWADSDESQKAPWTEISVTGRLDNGNGNFGPDRLFLLLQGPGECLVDDVEVFRTPGQNLVRNSGFESGATGWSFFGNHSRSFVQQGGAFSGSRCLHVVAGGDGDTGPNSIRTALLSGLAPGHIGTIRARVRWLRGWPQILFRLHGNWLELAGQMQIPKNLGTPGRPNSRWVKNAGPAIWDVHHEPILPQANQPVHVMARVDDPDGVATVWLLYRIDPNTKSFQVRMHDDGQQGDERAGDGVYTATIPGQSIGTLVAFRIQAVDGATPSAQTIFPEKYPEEECLIRWGDPIPPGDFPHYHIWSTRATQHALSSANGLDNTWRDMTLVYRDCRVIYNAKYRNKASPYHGGRGDFAVTVPRDDLLLGVDDRVFASTGNANSEPTAMRGQLANWMASELGIPFLHSRYIRVYINGSQFRNVAEDLQQPNRYYAEHWFPQGPEGDLYKVAVWFEFQDDNRHFKATGATLQEFKTTGGKYKMARYRWNWQIRPKDRNANWFEPIFDLVRHANAHKDYVQGLFQTVDMEEWMRIFAWHRVTGNWDSWAFRVGQNMFVYHREGYPWVMMPWDIDFVLGLGNGPTDALWGGQDPVVNRMFNTPAFQRALWRTFIDAVNGPMLPERYEPQIQARRRALLANRISGLQDPSPIRTYIDQRRNYILSQIQANDAKSFQILTYGGQDFTTHSPIVTLEGTAPFVVAYLAVNGHPYPVDWVGKTRFRIQVPLQQSTNHIVITGLDRFGKPIEGMEDSINIIYQGELDRPEDFVVIHEIYYHPLTNETAFVEIYNRSSTTTFDLSGWRLKGVGYEFPPGTLLRPNAYLLVVGNLQRFLAQYGEGLPVVGEFPGRLDNGGETLTLLRPGENAGEWIVVDEVRYDDDPPWPPEADGWGSSLQLVDPAQDNWRPGNWTVAPTNQTNRVTPGQPNSVATNLAPFPTLWLNEIQVSHTVGLRDRAGDPDPWVEILNTGQDAVDLGGLYLSDDPDQLKKWAFPTNTILPAGGYLVVWLDGEPDESEPGELHTSFRLTENSGVVLLSRDQANGVVVIDFLRFRFLSPNRSYGSYPDGQGKKRRTFDYPTPGAPNNPKSKPVQVFINEWMAGNANAVQDPADGDFEDWFELYNAGADPVDLTDYTLTDNPQDPTRFRIPAGFIIPPGGYLLVWADNEPQQTQPGRSLHVNFKLNVDGETIALYAPDGTLVDQVEFGPQQDNISEGRDPDGAPPPFAEFQNPTPGTPNSAGGAGNHAPVLDPIPDQTVQEGTLLTFTAHAIDPDEGQTITYRLMDAPEGATVDPQTGRFTWTPTEAQGPGIYHMALWAMDDGTPCRSAVRYFTIKVLEVNAPPKLEPIPDQTIDEGQPFLWTNVVHDPDLPPNQLTFHFAGDVPQGLTLDPTNGVMFWIPSEDQGPGKYTLTVVAEDNGVPVLHDQQTFRITVREVDNPPVIQPIPTRSILEGELFTFSIEAQDPDNPNTPLRYTFEGSVPQAVDLDPTTGIFTWIPTEEQGPGSYAFTVRVTEQTPNHQSSTVTFYLNVDEKNQAPHLHLPDQLTVREGDRVVLTNLASDPDLPPQHLHFSVVGEVPPGLRFLDEKNQMVWDIPADYGVREFDLTIQVQDDGSPPQQDTATMHVQVQRGNHLVINEVFYRPSVAKSDFVEIYNFSHWATEPLAGVQLRGRNLFYVFPSDKELGPGEYAVVVRDMEAFRQAFPEVPQERILGRFAGLLRQDEDSLRLIRVTDHGTEYLDAMRYATTAPWPAAQPGQSLQRVDPQQDGRIPANWVLVTKPSGDTVRLMDYTNIWSYNDTGREPDADWKAPNYDDSDWPSGPGLLYWEESDLPAPKNTTIKLGAIAFYFRSTFSYYGPTNHVRFILHTIVDDGCIVYLNGQEILRLGMPCGPVNSETFSARTIGNAQIEGPFTITNAPVRWGRNVLAVEVHQHSTTSSDVVWGLRVEVPADLFRPVTPAAPNSVGGTLPRFPQIWLNEVMVQNEGSITDTAGQADPWVELFSQELLPFGMGQLELETGSGERWQGPESIEIKPQTYPLIWLDGQTNQTQTGELHAAFRLTDEDRYLALLWIHDQEAHLLDWLPIQKFGEGVSYGSVEDDPLARGLLSQPTPGKTNRPLPPPQIMSFRFKDAQTLVLEVQTIPGFRYRLLHTAELPASNWDVVAEKEATGDRLLFSIPWNPDHAAFYRVERIGP